MPRELSMPEPASASNVGKHFDTALPSSQTVAIEVYTQAFGPERLGLVHGEVSGFDLYRDPHRLYIQRLSTGVIYSVRLWAESSQAWGQECFRWKANLQDLRQIPGLIEALVPSGLLESIKSPKTRGVLLARLVLGVLGVCLRGRVVHHRSGRSFEDFAENLEALDHDAHEHLHGRREGDGNTLRINGELRELESRVDHPSNRGFMRVSGFTNKEEFVNCQFPLQGKRFKNSLGAIARVVSSASIFSEPTPLQANTTFLASPSGAKDARRPPRSRAKAQRPLTVGGTTSLDLRSRRQRKLLPGRHWYHREPP